MNQIAIREPGNRSVLMDMSDRYGMEPAAFEATLRATVVPKDCSREQFAAFLLIAKEYRLNPILKEIYAFPAKGGGIQPIVGVDGWANLINSHPAFDGMDFEDHFNEAGELVSITCKMHRKDRSHVVTATEYLSECKRSTEPWTKWPRRMLRHKAMIQAARYAFSFAGIVDPDEADRFSGEFAQDVTPRGTIVPISQRIAASQSQAKEPEASGGLCAEASHAVQVGEADAVQPATSEFMDVTAGETATNSDSLQSPPHAAAAKPVADVAPIPTATGTNSESSVTSPADDTAQAGNVESTGLPLGWEKSYVAILRAVPEKKGLTPVARKFWAKYGSWSDYKDTPDGATATGIFDAIFLHFGNDERTDEALRELI